MFNSKKGESMEGKTNSEILEIIHKTFIANSTYSSIKKTSRELEKLNSNIVKSSESSTKLAKALNCISLIAIVISVLVLSLEIYKTFCLN